MDKPSTEMGDPTEESETTEKVKVSNKSSNVDEPTNGKPSASGFRKSPSSLSSTASSTGSDGQNKSSEPSSGDADATTEDDSRQKNQLNLLASVSVATKSESDSGGSDEPDTRDKPNKPQHQQDEAPQQPNQQQQALQANPNPVVGQQPQQQQQPDAKLTQQNVIQALQSMMNQPSNMVQPPNMVMIQQLAQHIVNAGNAAAIPPPAPAPPPAPTPGVFGPASNAAQLLLNQLTANATNYQNPAPALNFIQKLQELIMQQQIASNLSANPAIFNPLLAGIAALLQQQNQLQQQQQLSSLLAIQQLTNPTGQMPTPPFSIPHLAVANPAMAMMNQPGIGGPPQAPAAGSAAAPPRVFEPTGRPAVTLAADGDEDNLAPYQCLLRKQIELFETREDDIYLKAQGRNTPIRVGQVGIRCRHCANMAKSKRVEGSAVLYSKSLNGIYQVSLNMGRLHFLNNGCNMIPEDTKKKLSELKQLPRKVARGRQYWKETLESQGVIEEDEYLRFKAPSS